MTRSKAIEGVPVAERQVTGSRAEVAAIVDVIRDSGKLLARTEPREVSAIDPRVYVYVRYLEPVPVEPAPARARSGFPWRRVLTGAAIAVGGLTLAGFLLSLATRTLAAQLVAVVPALLGVAVAALLVVWFLLGRAGRCPCLHCPGCRCSR